MAEMKVLSDIKDLKNKDVDIQKQIGVLSAKFYTSEYYRNKFIKVFDMKKGDAYCYIYFKVLQAVDYDRVSTLEVMCSSSKPENSLVCRTGTNYSSNSKFKLYDTGTRLVGYIQAGDYNNRVGVQIESTAGDVKIINTIVESVEGSEISVSEKQIATSDEITDLQEKSMQYRGVISDNDSVANYTSKDKIGEWYVTSGVGTPSGYAYGYLTVYYNPNQNYIKHTFRDVYTNASFENSFVSGSWTGWSKIATTDKIDISSKLMGGWKVVDANCSIEATIVGDVLFVNGLIKNDGESSVCLDLSQCPPKDGKWHGGSAIGGSGNAKYFVIDPHGSAQFQAGYEKGVAYTINFHYRVY